jgi:hypothetical protein
VRLEACRKKSNHFLRQGIRPCHLALPEGEPLQILELRMDQFSLSFQEAFEAVPAELQSFTEAIDEGIARIVVVVVVVVVAAAAVAAVAAVVIVVVVVAAAAAAVAVAIAAADAAGEVVTGLNRGFHHSCLSE